jgi:hypothetical protein
MRRREEEGIARRCVIIMLRQFIGITIIRMGTALGDAAEETSGLALSEALSVELFIIR